MLFCATHQMPRHDSGESHEGTGTSRKRSRTSYDKDSEVLLPCSISQCWLLAQSLIFYSFHRDLERDAMKKKLILEIKRSVLIADVQVP